MTFLYIVKREKKMFKIHKTGVKTFLILVISINNYYNPKESVEHYTTKF